MNDCPYLLIITLTYYWPNFFSIFFFAGALLALANVLLVHPYNHEKIPQIRNGAFVLYAIPRRIPTRAYFTSL